MHDLTRGEPPQIHPPVRYCRVLHGSNMLTNAGSNKLDLLMKSSTRTRLRARSPRSRCARRRPRRRAGGGGLPSLVDELGRAP